ITRVGGERPISVDVRVIAATNKNLRDQIELNLFREDLYHRLSVILIHVPPLRERREDIPIITSDIAGRIARRNGLEQKPFTADAINGLCRFEWRGNVRELHNVVERLTILSQGDQVTAKDVDLYVNPGGSVSNPVLNLLDQYDQFSEFRDMAEKLFIESKLVQNEWNISKTSEEIGIQRSHLYNKMAKYDISRSDD
ncbi:MAG: sigma 54-interacting transcriptional regulator, partial [Bacteroidetes bacterium]|nr:sigma 54-interacting transcriptional regulator [Bacteroidota bacterium]